MASQDHVTFYNKNGYVVIENFLSQEEVDDLKKDVTSLLSKIELPKRKGRVDELNGTTYQIDSLDKASVWIEDGALGDDGELVLPIERAANKIAHGVHVVSEVARRIEFSDKMKEMVKTVSKVEDAALIQTMYMMKQPRIGVRLDTHQDETYLRVTPDGKVFGVWIALDDATEDNGCLEFVPGTHQPPLTYFYERVPLTDGGDKVIRFTGKSNYIGNKEVEDKFVKVPAKAGSAVLIHGLVVHRSLENRSSAPRRAFTFHVYDRANATWCERNCFQEREDYKFWNFYETMA